MFGDSIRASESLDLKSGLKLVKCHSATVKIKVFFSFQSLIPYVLKSLSPLLIEAARCVPVRRLAGFPERNIQYPPFVLSLSLTRSKRGSTTDSLQSTSLSTKHIAHAVAAMCLFSCIFISACTVGFFFFFLAFFWNTNILLTAADILSLFLSFLFFFLICNCLQKDPLVWSGTPVLWLRSGSSSFAPGSPVSL